MLCSPQHVLCQIQVRREDNRVVVRLAGRLTGAQVPDLLAACAEGPGRARVELDELVSADFVGMDVLLRIQEQGAQLIDLPEYLRFELETLARRGRR